LRMAVIAFIFLILVGVVFGTITYPTRDELILIASCTGLLIMLWLNRRDRSTSEKEV